ncbi:complex I subunit 5 family protein [Glycocaulis sp.]
MNLLFALVALPLLFMLASLVAGRHGPRLIWLAAPLMTGLAVWLAIAVHTAPEGGALGGWPVPLGIMLEADGLAAALMLASAITAAITGLFALGSYGSTRAETTRSYTFWPLFYGLWAAVNAVLVSRDLFNLYVAIELLSICAVALAAFGSRKAAMDYLMIALAGSLAYLLGVVLIFAAVGTLDLSLIAERAPEARASVLIGAALISAGLIAKTALFPLHGWLPPAHGAAPPAVSALLSALVVKASFVILLRVWFEALPGLTEHAIITGFGVLGAVAILYGSALALRQEGLKALIAYSTVAQLGYLFLVFPLAGGGETITPWAAGAWGAMGFHASAHMFAKAGLFLAAGLMIHASGNGRMDGLTGLARAMPVTTLAFALCAISLMGLPPSGGFMAKYLMLIASLASGQWPYALVIIAGGLMAAAYLFRPLARMFAGTETPAITPLPHNWLPLAPLALAMAAMALGLLSAAPYELMVSGLPEAGEAGLEEVEP